MALIDLLEKHSAEIVDEALAAALAARLRHYETSGAEVTRARLQALFDLALESLRANSPAPVKAHAERVAEERFAAGYGLREVQTAFNVLEEAVWHRVMRELPPAELGRALADVSQVLGAGKDELARAYVALATHTGAPSLHLEAMFKGTVTG